MNNISKIFNKYYIDDKKETMESYCLPKKFKLQPQQIALAEILSSKFAPWTTNSHIRGILLFHQIGAGKTCTAISIAERFKNKMDITVVLPASLISNFTSELRSECPGNEYLKADERNKLKSLSYDDKEYTKIIDKSNKRINKFYTIYSYHKLINLIKENKIKNLNNTLLIIDEIQNMISLTGIFYKLLYELINKSDNTLKIVLLTATPMFDRPLELGLTLNLLKKNDLFNINTFNQDFIINENNNYEIYNIDLFHDKIKNLISYYRGAPPIAYPKYKFKIVKCNMSLFQYKSYITILSSDSNFIRGSFKNADILNISESFFSGSRQISNISFPNKSSGVNGFSSLKGTSLQMQNIQNYSIKFYKIMQNINKSEGPVFIYSNFREEGGLKSFIQFIEYHGWKNYMIYGEGKKRFTIWSGKESLKVKDEIKYIFNQYSNENGSKIKLMLGSPSIKEGVSLFRVEQVHIMEPYWNMSRLSQIMGRAIRFCSHKDLPKERRLVDVFLYLATYKGEQTTDQYIWSLAKKKNKLITQFEKMLKESAIDCELFYNRNSYKTDFEPLKCKN